MKPRKKHRRTAALLLTALAACTFSMTVGADYYITGSSLGNQGMIRAYTPQALLGLPAGERPLKEPSDLFVSERGELYVADTGNNRVVVFSASGEMLREYADTYGERPLHEPQGVFSDTLGDVYIADTGNGRIVHLTEEGGYVEEFSQPPGEAYDDAYPFKPAKIVLDGAGKLYATVEYNWHGVTVLDGNNRFSGYIGGSRVNYTLIDRLVRIFATKEQKEQLARETPPYFSNILIKDGLIYATSFWEDTAQIKLMTPAGENIYPNKAYGETNEKNSFNFRPGFVDLAVDENGMIYAADVVTGKIYIYDREGNNLAVFGGSGSSKSTFDNISSIAVDGAGGLYVLDKSTGLIHLLRPTEVMKNILLGAGLFYEGKYAQALQPWETVRKLDESNLLAYSGIAKVRYQEGRLREAMALYTRARDKTGYSELFSDYRLEVLRLYFVPILLAVLLLSAALYLGVSRAKRYADSACKTLAALDKLTPRSYLKMGMLMLFHPIDALEMVKNNRRKISLFAILFLLAVIVGVNIASVYLVHFPFADETAQRSDLGVQIAGVLVPLFSWILMFFAISSISDGKQTFRESVFASLLSLLPYILLMLPIQGFSHLLSLEENALYLTLYGGVLIWSGWLLLLSCKVMNEYSFAKLIKIVLLTLFGVLCLWMIAMIFYTVIFQSGKFYQTISRELSIITG